MKRGVTPLKYTGRALLLLDQLLLPRRERWISCRSAADVARAIRGMQVRGAPAIGVSAAWGLALAARSGRGSDRTARALLRRLTAAARLLVRARPTAVNLAWAVGRVMRTASAASRGGSAEAVRKAVTADARAIEREDREANRRMGALGASLFRARSSILTHCNTGGLATAGYGTALGVIRAVHSRGRLRRVIVDETRPWLQGARLTAWELKRERIPFVLITDNMAGHFMGRGRVDAVIVGADRITALGDVANKIGTYSLAVLARHHGIPFYVAAPVSTLDLRLRRGSSIPIEERSPREGVEFAGVRVAPRGTRAAHPAFDVTPGRLVSAIITEKGIARAPYSRSLPRLAGVQ